MHEASAFRSRPDLLPLMVLFVAAAILGGGEAASAACPPGSGARITSGDPAAGPPVILTGLGGAPRGSFFLLGAGDDHNSGSLPATDWLVSLGDLDGDGLPDHRVEAPADGPGGWGDPRTAGCPAFASPAHPPVVLIVQHEREDLDFDGRFDIFEDFIRNGRLDPGEDLDGDHRLTPPDGCEGELREDLDCDGRLDRVNEDFNGNGHLDPGEDLDADGRLDPGTEDRNHNQILDDRPFLSPDLPPLGEDGNIDPTYPYGSTRPSDGGIIIISLAWNGTAYNLQALNTPTEFLGPIEDLDGRFTPLPYRLLRATPLDFVLKSTPPQPGPFRVPATFLVGGVHIDPLGDLRARIDIAGVALNDDVGGTRGIFDRVRLEVEAGGADDFLAFAETGATTVTLPSPGNLSAGAFLSFLPPATGLAEPSGPIRARALSVGSDVFLDASEPWPGLGLKQLQNSDDDYYLQPFDLCPDQYTILFPQAFGDPDRNGLGLQCDTGGPHGTALDRWEPALPAGALSPSPKYGMATAYDSRRGVVVLFGGQGGDDRTTWEFDGSSWRAFTPAAAPEGRYGHRMVYHARRARIVMYGGISAAGGGTLADHWEYDTATHAWSQVTRLVGPGPRSDFALTYDIRRGALMLFGGARPGGPALGDTWVFSLGTWKPVPSPRSPSPRSGVVAAYDAFHGVSVIAGGTGVSGDLLNDTWEFDGSVWQTVDYRGNLPWLSGLGAGFDPSRRQVLVPGGAMWLPVAPYGFSTPSAVRPYDGVGWSALPTLTPLPVLDPQVAAFDAGRRVLVMFGRQIETGTGEAGTFELILTDDADADGVADTVDDCPLVPDPDQADADGDGSGDLCDNCPQSANPDQRDLDRDLAGDACDDDRDGDGVADAADVCPDAYVPGRHVATILQGGGADGDGDAVADDCDRCPDDPANDVDGDGWCADIDNCPLTRNPMQQDANGDGAGDACQPAVDIVSIAPVSYPAGALNARVRLADTDRDRLHGMITVAPASVALEVVTHGLDACANAVLPDGVAGEGFVYADVPGSGRLLADVDSNFGCGDGFPDVTIAIGACADTAPADGSTILTIDRPAPFPVCVRRLNGSAAFDLVLYSAGSGAAVLSSTLPAVISVDYAFSRLPRSIPLGALAAPGPYILKITASDDHTPTVSDEELFNWNGETALYFNLLRRGLAPAPALLPGRPSVTPL